MCIRDRGTASNTPAMDSLDPKASDSSSSANSYKPRIISSPRNWSALLARHYNSISNFKLCITLIINILLLTYKVWYSIPGLSVYIVWYSVRTMPELCYIVSV